LIAKEACFLVERGPTSSVNAMILSQDEEDPHMWPDEVSANERLFNSRHCNEPLALQTSSAAIKRGMPVNG
jgi:hypothetical protein